MTQKGNRAAAFAAVNMGTLEKLDPGLISRCHGLPVAQVEEMIAERKARSSIWDDLETPLKQEPLFPVEQPDGRKDLSEIDRAVMFRKYLRQLAPKLIVFPNANAGKRSRLQAQKEGIVAGVPDYTICWDIAESTKPDAPVSIAFVELKGYSAAGQPGKLSDAQIDFMNKLHRNGHKVACFFSGKSAFDWLASIGAPIRGRFAA